MKKPAALLSVICALGVVWYFNSSQQSSALPDMPHPFESESPIDSDPHDTAQASQNSADATPARLEASSIPHASVDEDALRTVSSLTTDLSVIHMNSEQLLSILAQHGVRASRTKAGNPRTGERYEITGEGPEKGLLEVRAMFDLMEDGSEQMLRLQFSLPPGSSSFEQLNDQLQQRMGATTPSRVSESTSRWELSDQWTVWTKSFDDKDPFWGKHPSTVLVTMEYIVE